MKIFNRSSTTEWIPSIVETIVHILYYRSSVVTYIGIGKK